MPTLYEYYNTGDDGVLLLQTGTWGAQTFTVGSSQHIVTSVKLLLYRVGTTPGTLTVSIRATSGGVPTGADLCSGTTDGSTLPTSTSPEWREITFTSQYTLSAGTAYAIVARTNLGSIGWRTDDTSPSYSGGTACSSSDSGLSWSTSAKDRMFEVWTSAHAISASATRGHSVTVSKVTHVSPSASITLGRDSTTIVEKNITTFLCIASENSGSIRSNDRLGASWSVCAKDANGTLDASYLAQFDNRLCVLGYQNAGFGYSSANDIVSNWTRKASFPNLVTRFTGMFTGKDASDEPALYFLTQKGMYYLDVFTNFVFGPTEVTWEEDNTSGKKGLYWKGDTYVAVGKGIYKISAGVVTLVGPDMDDGLPEDLQGAVTDMIGVGFWLVIAVDGGANKSCILKRYINGTHWHPVYVTSTADSPIRALCWDNGTLYFGEGSNVKSMPFPAVTDNVNKLSTYERASTGSLTYPYFHSVFETMPKVAHRVWATTKDCNANENISVYYRINENTGWTLLGSFTSSPKPTALSFGSSGLEFEKIQLKATFARGDTATNSPKLESLILEYRVIPPTLWGMDVKINAVTDKDVRGKDIIDAMRTAVESKTLLSFYPSGDKSDTQYFVEVKGMPISAQKGTEFGEEGVFILSLQEVIDA